MKIACCMFQNCDLPGAYFTHFFSCGVTCEQPQGIPLIIPCIYLVLPSVKNSFWLRHLYFWLKHCGKSQLFALGIVKPPTWLQFWVRQTALILGPRAVSKNYFFNCVPSNKAAAAKLRTSQRCRLGQKPLNLNARSLKPKKVFFQQPIPFCTTPTF